MSRVARIYPEALAIFLVGWTMFGIQGGYASERESASVLSIICMGGILARAIPYWRRMTYLEQGFSIIVFGLLVFGAIATYNLDRSDAPASGVIWWQIGLRWLLAYLLLGWPRWVGRVGKWHRVQ
jgi:hypothetical protein